MEGEEVEEKEVGERARGCGEGGEAAEGEGVGEGSRDEGEGVGRGGEGGGRTGRGERDEVAPVSAIICFLLDNINNV